MSRACHFTNLGDVNSHLTRFEQSLSGDDNTLPELANSMLVFLVRELFSNLSFSMFNSHVQHFQVNIVVNLIVSPVLFSCTAIMPLRQTG